MTYRIGQQMGRSKKLLLAFAGTSAITLPIALGILNVSQSEAQIAASARFEVASIKPSPFTGQGGVGIRISGNRLLAQHQPLAELVTYAYDIQDYQLSGGPAWVYSRNLFGSDVYEVAAKSEGESVPTQEQLRRMFQALLVDRFKLQLHRETKEMQAYALVVASKGEKLKAHTPDPEIQAFKWTTGRLENVYAANAVSMESLVVVLKAVTGRPIVDKTGLTGTYKFDLRYANEPPTAESTAPSIFTAVQEQLGLKLESVKEPFEVLVLDHVERPSEN